jgi:pyruvate formate lyase activating enzyme
MTVDEVMEQVLQDKDFYLFTNGGMTISGGEMLSHPDFSMNLLEAAKSHGISVAIDTSGYGSFERLLSLAEKCDYILYDIKHIREADHIRLTGVSNRRILDSLKRLSAISAIREKITIRMPFVADANDGMDTAEETAAFLEDCDLREVTLLAYHNLGVSKRRNIGGMQQLFEAPDDQRMRAIEEVFHARGIHASIMGNNTQQ